MTCECHSYPPIPFERPAVTKRIKESKRIKSSLVILAEDKTRGIALFRCPTCGEHWQSGREWNFANEEYLFRVPAILPEEWEQEHYREPAAMLIYSAVLHDYHSRTRFVESADLCRHPGCTGKALTAGVFCKQHHIESMIRNKMLPAPPTGRLFPPYHEGKK
jgi:hypothetical protein